MNQTMNGPDFIALCRAVLTEHGFSLDERNTYVDDYIALYVSQYGQKDYRLVAERKAIDDPERPHLNCTNPTTYLVTDKETGEEKIIRHHGEHFYLIGHMLWLLSNGSEKARTLYKDLTTRYPKYNVQEGY